VASALTLMADGAVFGFVIFHGDFEHIITAYTDAVNLGWFVARLALVRGAGMLGCVRLAHDRILTRCTGSARSSETEGTALHRVQTWHPLAFAQACAKRVCYNFTLRG